MAWKVLVLCFILQISVLQTTDNDYEKVPPLNQMDNFLQCREQGNLFCRIQFTLRPRNLQSTVWQIIQDTKDNPSSFNRDVVYRYRCFPADLDNRRVEFIENATLRENRLLRNFSMNAYVDYHDCKNYSKEVKLTTFDYALLYTTLAWFAIIAAATLSDVLMRIGNFGGVLSYSKPLSLLSNWEGMTSHVENQDYQRLKSIQGIRTYNLMIVILGHTIFTALFSFTSDTNYIENFYQIAYKKFGLNFGLHIVQTNFVISGLLLSSHMYSYLEKKKNRKISIGFVVKSIVHRYLRLFPALAFVICWQMSNWSNALLMPPPSERNDMDFRACQKNWWATLMFINNFFLQSETCNLGTWYLANDFQMFVLAMFLFYIMVNYNIGGELILWTMGLFWFIHAYLIYYNNLGVIFNFSPENSKVENSVATSMLNVLYSSFYANYGGYAIGLIFGGLYHKYKNHAIKVNEFVTYSWLMVFFGFPISAVYLSLFEYPRLLAGIIGASLKPLYSLGIAVGILGLSHGIGGVIKKVCEWDFAVFLAKWTYSTYLIQFGIIFGRYLMLTDLVPMSDVILAKSIISDLVTSFLAGLVLHLLIERPMSIILQKMTLPTASPKIKSG